MFKLNPVRVIFLSLLLVASFIAAAEESETAKSLQTKVQPGALIYQVLPGEYLTGILRAMGFKNLWGKNGIVARTISGNPDVEKSPEKLEPWSLLTIVATSVPNTEVFEVVDGQIRRKPQTIDIYCPDHSVHHVKAQYLPAKTKGEAPQMILFDDPSCNTAAVAPTIVPAETTAANSVTNESVAPSTADAKSESTAPSATQVATPVPSPPPSTPATSSERPIMPIRTGPQTDDSKVDESLPKTFDPAAFADDTLYAHHPFSIALEAGYSDDTFQFGSGGHPVLNGFNYGVRVEYHPHWSNWGILIGVGYRQAQFTDSESGGDYLILNMLEPAVGISWKQLILRGGMAFNQATDANATMNASFADRGWFASLSKLFDLTERLSLEIEARYTNVIYTPADNSSLNITCNSVQLEALLAFGFHF